MLNSVRIRLTLWHAGLLALALLAFALAAYVLVARLALRQTDAALADAANEFAIVVVAESEDEENRDTARAIAEAMREVRFRDRRFWLFDARQKLVATNADGPAAASAPPPVNTGYATFTDANGGRGRAYAQPLDFAGQRYALAVARPLNDQDEMLRQLRLALFAAIPLTLLCAALGGYFLARRSLRPVAAMGDTAARIGAANLHERLPVANEKDELGRLALVFNGLLGRLDDSFTRQKQFMADASHELRTPVAIVCGESEVTLARADRPAGEYREALAIVHEEGRRLTRIVEDLFTLARADAGNYPLNPTDFYLEELVAECVRAARSLAGQRGITLQRAAAAEMPFRGDETLLRRMLLNLLDNALKHTSAGGCVTVACQPSGASYNVTA